MTTTGHDPSTGKLPDRWVGETLGESWRCTSQRHLEEGTNQDGAAYPVYGANGQIGFYTEFNHADQEVTVTCTGASVNMRDNVNVIPAKFWISGNAMVVRPMDAQASARTSSPCTCRPSTRRFTVTHRDCATPDNSQNHCPPSRVARPPLAEQEQIVEILEGHLSRLDAALQHIQTLRDKAAQFRRSLLHAAFTGALTGHDPSTGELPDRWVQGTLGEAVAVVMGQSPPGSSYNTDGIGDPFFQGKKEFGELHPTVEKWTTAGKKFAKAGDILMSVRAPVGPTNVAQVDCVIGRGLAAIRGGTGLDQAFLLLSLRAFESEIAAKGTGTTFDSISGDALRGQTLLIPPLAEQEQIIEILEGHLSRLDAAMAVADAVEERAGALRRSLLHAAFTGKLTEKWREQAHG